MIVDPINDRVCLDALTAEARKRVEGANPDRALAALARELGSVAALVRWTREQPQRDDRGDVLDGPRVNACRPTQRLRFDALEPNCVERAVLYLTVAELIDPGPRRWLDTMRTSSGLLHTFPRENGVMVVLDPIIPSIRPVPVTTPVAHAPRNGIGAPRLHPSVVRALRVAARAAAIAGPSLAVPAASIALASVGVPPVALVSLERALRADGLTLGISLLGTTPR